MTTLPNPDLATQAPSRERSAYCDTGLIVAAVMGRVDPFFDDAVRFLNEARSSGVRLIISSITLAEAADVIRRRVKASRRCTDESGRECEEIEAKAAAYVERISDFIDYLKHNKMVGILEEEITVDLDFEHLYKMMLKYAGRTPQARRGNTYRHEGIGPIDWIHIALALLAGVQSICTNDKAIAQIKGDKRYGGIEIIMLRPR